MSRSRPLSVVLIAMALVGGAYGSQGVTAGAGSPPLTARLAGPYHSIPTAFAGFNAPFRKNSWQALSPELRQAAAGLAPGALRVFGGTTANYWNWRAGQFYDRHGVPRPLRRANRRMSRIYMADWARLVRDANALPVFDLNVVTSHLSSQLAMLRRARDLGMPIRWIELGNELYDHAPLIDRAMPTPGAYGRKATRWIHAIKRRFPHAKVAAVGLGSSIWWPPRTRRGRWDPGVLRTLRGEDAVTFHTYWKPPPGRLSQANLSRVLAAPLRRLFELRAGGLRQLPDGVVAWVTEWNVRHGSALRGTWANGLSDAEYLLALLGEPRVRQEDLHALIDRRPFAALFANAEGFGAKPATVPFAPTAVGRTFGELYPLLSGAPRVGRLTMEHAPHIHRTRFAAIQAVAVKGQGALLLNLAGQKVRVRLAAGLACNGTLDSIWARPAARITGHAGEINHKAVEVQGALPLPPYSINRLDC
ncbi:MAG: hypothetical protein AUG48_01875 [Actinobacteria bacterium 13_1_20CM_3_68_9]|nr:MAG: hypothetical protein AUG48_01875 [Actinobacteria bacterium 13_1_20CM_3_68_9]